VKCSKRRTIGTEEVLFDVLMCWIHKLQDKISILNLLSSALKALVTISQNLLDTLKDIIYWFFGNELIGIM